MGGELSVAARPAQGRQLPILVRLDRRQKATPKKPFRLMGIAVNRSEQPASLLRFAMIDEMCLETAMNSRQVTT